MLLVLDTPNRSNWFFLGFASVTMTDTRLNWRYTVVRYLGWSLMAAAHLPGFVASWSAVIQNGASSGSLGGCIYLTVSMLFFGLKLADVAWLRFRTDRRSLVACFIVLGVLHCDVMRHNSDASGVPEYAAIAASAVLLSTLLPIRRLVISIAQQFNAGPSPLNHLARSADSVWFDAFHPHCWALVFRLLPPRAPPV